jgi:AcrR family transcriptional regulator
MLLRGKQASGLLTQQKMLRAAVKLFLEKRYEGTTTAEIARAAGMPPSSFFRAFPSKEALLLELDKRMFSGQFTLAEQHSAARALRGGDGCPAPPLRELYVTAYTLSSISAYLYRSTAKRLEGIFGDDLPDAEAKDFYEMEIASTGMMRSFVAVPCDMYFTVERKIARFLECAFKLCNVPPERRRGRRTIGRVGRYLMAPI